MLKKYWKINKDNLVFSLIIVVLVKIAGDISRPYSAFGGEDLLLVGAILYWIVDYVSFKKENACRKKYILTRKHQKPIKLYK